MKNKKSIMFLSIFLVLVSIATALFVFYEKSETEVKQTQIESTTKKDIETQQNIESETNKETVVTTEKLEEIVATESEKTTINNYSNNEYKPNVVQTTNKTTVTEPKVETTKETTTEQTTLNADYYNKDKFPVGYATTSSPHYSPETKGAYWVSGKTTFVWKPYKQIEDVDGTITYEYKWLCRNISHGLTGSEANTEILIEKVKEQAPTWDGEYEGQEYPCTVWVWLPY